MQLPSAIKTIIRSVPWVDDFFQYRRQAIFQKRPIASGPRDYSLMIASAAYEIGQLLADDAHHVVDSIRRSRQPGELTDGHLRRTAEVLHKEGVVAIPAFLSANECDVICSQIRAVRAKLGDRNFVKLPDGASIERRGQDVEWDSGMLDIRHVEFAITSLEPIMHNDFVRRLVSVAEGAACVPIRMHAYVNLGVRNTRRYHVDDPKTHVYKSFIYLTDVPDESYGPYSFVRGSHRLDPLRYVNRAWSNMIDDLSIFDTEFVRRKAARHFIGPKGTLIVSSQNGSHRGLPQGPDRERILISTVYVLGNPSK